MNCLILKSKMGQMNDIEIILRDMVIIHDQSGEIIGRIDGEVTIKDAKKLLQTGK